MTTLTFHEESHSYFVDGLRYPSVTQIIGAAGLVDYSHVPAVALETARQQGQATHRMIELDSAGTLDVDALPEWMGPVWKAWSAFKESSGFVPILNEYRAHHPTLRFAGTMDLVGELPKLKGWKGAALIDVKRSLFGGPVIGLQTAAYAMLLESDPGMPKINRRGALRIGNDGRFVLQPFDEASDRATFLALLTLNRFREKHNLKG